MGARDRDRNRKREERPLRDEIPDPDFQRAWQEARHLTGEEVDRAFEHGLFAQDRFAERPFREVEAYLRESWEAMGIPTPWEEVSDIVESGYELDRAAPLEAIAESAPEARDRFTKRTAGGSTIGGALGHRSHLGASEPVSDYDGESGPPIEDGRRVED